MNNMQAWINGMSAQWQQERAETQITLGEMIKTLEAMPQEAEIKGLGELGSYRGYYCDLAFSKDDGAEPVFDVLDRCNAAMGKVFTGYKGGDYMMGENTPMWVADYGDCGVKIVRILDSGEIETAEDE